MTALELTFIIGIVVTPLVSLIKREHWSDQVKFLTAAALSAVVGLVQVVFNNHIHNFGQFIPYWSTAIVAMQATYHLYFRDTKLDNLLTKLGSTQ